MSFQARPHIISIIVRIALGMLLIVTALLIAPLSRPDLRQDYNQVCGWWLELPHPLFHSLHQCPSDLLIHGVGSTAHPPFATLVLLPLGILSWPLVYYVWIILSGIAVTGTWILAKIPTAACVATLPLWIAGLYRGSLEPIIFLFLGLALAQTSRPRLKAAMLGIAGAFKVYPILLLGGVIIRRKYTELGIAVVVGIAVTIVAELVLGRGTIQAWLALTPQNMLRWIDTPDNVSLVRIFWSISELNPSLVAFLTYIILTFMLAWRNIQGVDERSMLPIMLLSTPLTWSHYIGHITLKPLSRSVIILLALGSSLFFVGSLGILPITDAAFIYTPLLVGILMAWYQSMDR